MFCSIDIKTFENYFFLYVGIKEFVSYPCVLILYNHPVLRVYGEVKTNTKEPLYVITLVLSQTDFINGLKT
jgi:hypothetical protein